MTVQFISGLFFLKWALGPQLQEAMPISESPLLLSRQQVGTATLVKGVGEALASRKKFVSSKQGMEGPGVLFHEYEVLADKVDRMYIKRKMWPTDFMTALQQEKVPQIPFVFSFSKMGVN